MPETKDIYCAAAAATAAAAAVAASTSAAVAVAVAVSALAAGCYARKNETGRGLIGILSIFSEKITAHFFQKKNQSRGKS